MHVGVRLRVVVTQLWFLWILILSRDFHELYFNCYLYNLILFMSPNSIPCYAILRPSLCGEVKKKVSIGMESPYRRRRRRRHRRHTTCLPAPLLDSNLSFLLGRLGHDNAQDAVLQACLHSLLIDLPWEAECALELANRALADPVLVP